MSTLKVNNIENLSGAKVFEPTILTPVTASGTEVDFLDIPSWVKRVTIMFNGISTNGTSPPTIQLGTSSGIENSGYDGTNHIMGTGVVASALSSGFRIGVNTSNWVATNIAQGYITINKFQNNNNTYVCNGLFSNGGSATFLTSGRKELSGILDRIRITTDGGANVFDAGSINIMYE